MPIQFIVNDVVVWEYDDYLRPPVSPARQEELRQKFSDVVKGAYAVGAKHITIKHVQDTPEEKNFRLVSNTEVK